jgi:serine O-acetyltransferase
MADTDKPGAGNAQTDWNLDEVVQQLRQSREVAHKIRHKSNMRDLPSKTALVGILQGLCATLFPTHYGRANLTDESIDYFVGDTLNTTLNLLAEQIRRALVFGDDMHGASQQELTDRARWICREFASQLPALRELLVSDLHAAYQGDPAASSISEILLCYPGAVAVIYYRIAHALLKLGARLVARLISDIAHSDTGIDIHPGAQIGGSFFIDHGTGVVIGETAIIGQRVRLYQAVTLGARRFPADESGALIKGIARHPIVEDDVVIYAGATILGRITIGRGSTIGGNVWITHDVPPGSNVSQATLRNSDPCRGAQ